MGGPVRMGLASHAKDDVYFNKKKSDLKKHLPKLQRHLIKMKQNGQEHSASFAILNDFETNLSTNFNNQTSRIPMHVLNRGEKVFKDEVLQQKMSPDELYEIIWRAPGFRQGVVRKLEQSIEKYGNPVQKSAQEMEEFIFKKAKKKEEYLEDAARIVVFLKQKFNSSNSSSSNSSNSSNSSKVSKLPNHDYNNAKPKQLQKVGMPNQEEEEENTSLNLSNEDSILAPLVQML